MKENTYIEKKRLDAVIGKKADWKELAKDCVCFANGRGGKILIGIANDAGLPDTPNVVSHWLGRLLNWDILISKGRTKGTEYMVNPDFLKKTRFKGRTNLKRIENHRLEELIYQDLSIYEIASINDIHKRIGEEIPLRRVKFMIDKMVANGKLIKTEHNRWTQYALNEIP